MNLDLIVVGSGISGAVLAHDFALANKKVLILEKRNHIAGNMYDHKKENIFVHNYGPHIFHTNKENVYNYMSKFWELNDYRNVVEGYVNGKLVPIPFNFKGIDIFFPEHSSEIKKQLIDQYGEGARVPIAQLLANDNLQIKKVAKFIYKNIFENYTIKMWGIKIKKMDPEVLKRVPVSISYSNTYFQNKYEGIPKNGYTNAIKKMITHKNIKIKTNINALSILKFKNNKTYFEGKIYNGIIIYCGPVDELFDFKFGHLPYRSLDIKFKTLKKNDFQKTAVVNYPADPKITRITEYKKMMNAKSNKTIISIETPGQYDPNSNDFFVPYYPISNNEGLKMIKKYFKLAKKYKNFYLLGRLATFQYLNMDDAIFLAMKLSKKLLGEINE